MLAAIASLDVEVIGEVLEETQERDALIQELREKITRRTRGSNMTQEEILGIAFREIDTDGSGEINKKEFQALLIQMDMCYSGKRFRSLYNAIDRNNDGSLSIEELNHILFPQAAKEMEAQMITQKVRSQLEHQLTTLEEEASTELSRSGNVSVKQHTKRLKKITSLKTLKSITSQSTIPLQATLESAEQLESMDDDQNPDQSIPHIPRRPASSPGANFSTFLNNNRQILQERLRSQSQPVSFLQSGQPRASDEFHQLNSLFEDNSLPPDSSPEPSTSAVSDERMSRYCQSDPLPNGYFQNER